MCRVRCCVAWLRHLRANSCFFGCVRRVLSTRETWRYDCYPSSSIVRAFSRASVLMMETSFLTALHYFAVAISSVRFGFGLIAAGLVASIFESPGCGVPMS